jgi:predicted nucleotidyltransferase
MPENDFGATLRVLREARVDFILVGGLSAVLNGVPAQTYDVDIVHSRDAANVERLTKVLESLDAIFRIQPERRIRPAPSHLAGTGHLNLITTFGPLDLLGTIGRDLDYSALLPHSSEKIVAEGVTIRVLDLETLIAIKEELGGEKERAMLPLLRRTLEEELRSKPRK